MQPAAPGAAPQARLPPPSVLRVLPVEPDDVAHAGLGDALADAGAREDGGHGLGPRRRGAGLEPREQLVDELVVATHDQLAAAGAEVGTDAVHEAVLGGRALDLRLGEDHHRFVGGDLGLQFARLVDARGHAAGQRGGTQSHDGQQRDRTTVPRQAKIHTAP